MINIEEEKLKSILLERKYVLDEDIFLSKPKNMSLIDYITTNNILTYKNLSNILNSIFNIEEHKLDINEINMKAIKIFDYVFVSKYNLFPFNIVDDKIYIVMSDPLNNTAYENIKLVSGMSVKVYFTNSDDIKFFINYFYVNKTVDSISNNFEKERKFNILNSFEGSSVIKIIDYIIDSAIFLSASDIHIEPLVDKVRIRFRIDGYLQEQKFIDKPLFLNLISRFKIMAGMDITLTRLPQDGYFKECRNGIEVDFRLSTLPTIYGEKLVIRLIYDIGINYNSLSESLGFFKEDIDILKNLLKNQHGIILITGTTGSGKTTTLSSFISYLNNEDVNIITIEDPVENPIKGVNHVNINLKINLDFHNVLRAILRQDPNIIMIGEIRDSKTAKMAIRAAITGHLVLSTLHTNDSLSAITRLVDMGVEEYLVISALKGIVSQFLVRRLCDNCKKKIKISKEEADLFNMPRDIFVYEAVGCNKCSYIGYKGRLLIYEIIIINEEIRQLVKNKKFIGEKEKKLLKNNISSIKDNICKNIIKGNTSINEVYKVLYTNI